MMKKVIALLLMAVLVGCSSSSWVSVSGNEGYDIYRNGELVCKSTVACRVKSTHGKEMLLEARKDSIVYGHLLVARQDSKHGSGALSTTYHTVVNTEKFLFGFMSPHGRGDTMLYLFASGAVFAGAILALPIILMLPDNLGRLPENMTIPTGANYGSLIPFPWDQPALR
ncbi:hypothetical protein IKQ19_08035 [Candidatus Saccharibacteria bacterium]|nr:hypothetical protein [Candidatus Saccharibacteria bacterium]